ncbi:MAG: hypothetical protein ACK4Q4_07575, partial [Rhodocyclaceae bacterium]
GRGRAGEDETVRASWVQADPKKLLRVLEVLETAEQHPGSWWTDWQAWVTSLSDERLPARDPAKGKLGVIEDAPGSYVKFRLDQQTA